jgi:hypothetical protein
MFAPLAVYLSWCSLHLLFTYVDVRSICYLLCKAELNAELIDASSTKTTIIQQTCWLLIVLATMANKVYNIMEPCVNSKVSSNLTCYRNVYKHQPYILIQRNWELKWNQNLMTTYKISDDHFDSLTLLLIPYKVVITWCSQQCLQVCKINVSSVLSVLCSIAKLQSTRILLKKEFFILLFQIKYTHKIFTVNIETYTSKWKTISCRKNIFPLVH